METVEPLLNQILRVNPLRPYLVEESFTHFMGGYRIARPDKPNSRRCSHLPKFQRSKIKRDSLPLLPGALKLVQNLERPDLVVVCELSIAQVMSFRKFLRALKKAISRKT